MIRLVDIAFQVWFNQAPITPYDTGNLLNSRGSLQSTDDRTVEYEVFNKNSRAAYGAILNDSPVIQVRTADGGRTRGRTYVNKHYRWIDNFVESEVERIRLEIGAR